MAVALTLASPFGGVVADDPHERAAAHAASSFVYRAEWRGTSTIHLVGACVLTAGCAGDYETEPGSFFLGNGGTDGTILLSWRPASAPFQTLRAKVGQASVEGESPLTLRVGDLLAGTHVVEVEPLGQGVGSQDQQISWVASFSVYDAQDPWRESGRSSFDSLHCPALQAECYDALGDGAGGFIFPWNAGAARLVAQWTAKGDSDARLQIDVPGTAAAGTGHSPLLVDLSGLPAGEYRVRATAAAGFEPVSGEIAWQVFARQS